MEQWFGDQYDVQEMGSLSGLISRCTGIINIGVGASGWGCRARQDPQ